MNSHDTNKTSEQLQHEAHEQIDRVGADIEHARARMSPGSLLDDAIFYPHGQSLTSTYSHMKRNPMGSMFLSLGTLLLMEDQHHVSYESRFKEEAGKAAAKGKENLREAKESVSEKASELQDKAKSATKRFKREAQEYRDELEGAEGEIESKAWEKTSEVKAKAKDAKAKAKEVREKASRKASETAEKAREKISEAQPALQNVHPFAIASIGLGMGATFGASFPMRKVEDKLQSPAFQERAGRLGEEFESAVRESGERLKNHLIDELKQFNFH